MTELRADCSRCFALCCVALPFARSAHFAIDKPAGTPCGNLRADFGCGVHERLPDAGFAGCAAYDCFGAGQRVARDGFGGRDWRAHPELAAPMFAAFRTMRHLHELLWYLTAALDWTAAAPVHDALRAAQADVEQVAAGDPSGLVAVEVDLLRGRIGPLLRRASALARDPHGPDCSDADLAGADLRALDLRRASLRNARLIGADLRGADLSYADVLGADLRGADVRGADLRATLFLTRSQLGAMRSDDRTRVPCNLKGPRIR